MQWLSLSIQYHRTSTDISGRAGSQAGQFTVSVQSSAGNCLLSNSNTAVYLRNINKKLIDMLQIFSACLSLGFFPVTSLYRWVSYSPLLDKMDPPEKLMVAALQVRIHSMDLFQLQLCRVFSSTNYIWKHIQATSSERKQCFVLESCLNTILWKTCLYGWTKLSIKHPGGESKDK